MATITVNGKTLQTTHSTVQLLLGELGLNVGRYAVEIDGQLIPKSQLPQIPLTDGMCIEVVQAVGGG